MDELCRSMSAFFRVSALLGALSLPSGAIDYYVDNQAGNDAFDGTSKTPIPPHSGPFATLTHAIILAGPGDTIHLNPTGKAYRQRAYFSKGGAPGSPIVLDGHGATLSGADVCSRDGWEPWADGVFRRGDMNARSFIVADGDMIFPSDACDALQPGEFAFERGFLFFHPPAGVKAEECGIEVGQESGGIRLDAGKWERSNSRIGDVRRYRGLAAPEWIRLNGDEAPIVTAKERLEAGAWCAEGKRLYYRPPAGKTVGEMEIECGVRDEGVAMSGVFSHVIVRNLTAVHVCNDGYNIHGRVTNVEFHNCHAHHCFDEGFSAHDDCETILDGAVYGFCDNGIYNINVSGFSITRNVIVHNSRSHGFGCHAKAGHVLENAVFIDNPIQISAGNLEAGNILAIGTPRCREQTIGVNGRFAGSVTLRRATMIGNSTLLTAVNGAMFRFENCLFCPGQGGLVVQQDADPAAMFSGNNVIAGLDLNLEWGRNAIPLQEWLQRADSGQAAGAWLVRDTPEMADLLSGRLPADSAVVAGCEPALFRQYLDFIRAQAQAGQ